jgi:hypothetical protein
VRLRIFRTKGAARLHDRSHRGCGRDGLALMRYLLALWALPLVLFWGWFGLSFYDINFGYVMLTRQVHDLLFELYGEILGLDPKTIPWLIAKACIFDTLILMAIWAFRRRREIQASWRRWREGQPAAAPLPDAFPRT